LVLKHFPSFTLDHPAVFIYLSAEWSHEQTITGEIMKKKITWLLAAVLITGLCAGCDSGSDSSDDEYTSFVFINDTGKDIRVFRDGGTDWKGSESFELNHQGEERTVELEEKGKIGFSYVVLDSGEVKTEISGREIFFRYN
jgi:hypothetical protein